MKKLYTFSKNGESFDYLLDVGRRSRAYLNIRDGVLTVRLPYGGTRAMAEQFIESKLDWIKQNLSASEDRSHLPRGFDDGESFSLLGSRRELRIAESPTYREPELSEEALTVYISPDGTRADAERLSQRYILELCEKRVRQAFDKYTQILGLYPKRITLKKMTSRWGSCSSNGNISINVGVICFSQECIDYVVVHELCHLKHMDHGNDFWKLVSTCCPNYKKLREIMKH